MNEHLDERDRAILAERQAAWNERTGPRVGDFVRFPDGSMARFTHDWGESIQISCTKYGGSFYLGHGYASYSGGLEPGIKKEFLVETNETEIGRFWFFHRDWAEAHNGVNVDLGCRVYEVKS